MAQALSQMEKVTQGTAEQSAQATLTMDVLEHLRALVGSHLSADALESMASTTPGGTARPTGPVQLAGRKAPKASGVAQLIFVRVVPS